MSTCLKTIFIIGMFSLIITIGCSQTSQPTTNPEPVKPSAALSYDFINRDATSQAEIEEVIGSVVAGYLIVNDEYPRSLLVNYLYKDKCFYFPLITSSHPVIFKDLQNNPKVCFAVDKYTQLHWWSANIFGKAQIIKETALVSKWLNEYENVLGKDGFNYPAQKDLPNTVMVKITPETISGRKMTDPQNPNFAPRLPWITLSHGKADTDVAAKLLPVEISDSTLPKEISLNGVDSKVAESILKGVGACRLNLLDTEYPYSIPMSVMSYNNGKVLLHSNKKGHKMDCLRTNTKVSVDYQWFWNNSNWIGMYLEGHINIIEKPEDIAQVLGMGETGIPMAERMAQRMAVLEFVPEKIVARQIEIPLKWYSRMPGTKTR
ncbi:MAG: pyridoxamine 5'-phosphate oxidase family protein [Planctomycetota bacterium]